MSRIRISETRMVKQIVKLTSEFELFRLCQFERLGYTKVNTPEPRARERIDACCPKRSDDIGRERSRVEPFIYLLSAAPPSG